MLVVIVMFGIKCFWVFFLLFLGDWFIRCDEKEGGSGEICLIIINLFYRKYFFFVWF